MKNSILILIMLLSTISIFAQKDSPSIDNFTSKIMIGTSFGTTSGSGISARYVSNNSGVTFTILPNYVRNENFSHTNLNMGLSYNYYVRTNRYVDFSMKVSARRQQGGLFSYWTDNPDRVRVNLGIGPEINFHLLPEIDVDVHLGYGLYDITKSLNSSLSASVGFYYNIYQ